MVLELIRKIEFDGNTAGTKLLILSYNPPTIREKIKYKIKASHIFLNRDGYPINKELEKDYLLENLTAKKSIKLKSEGIEKGLDKFFNGTKVCSANCSLLQNLSEVKIIIS